MDTINNTLETTPIEELSSTMVTADQDDDWDAEYWIIRERPPYRV